MARALNICFFLLFGPLWAVAEFGVTYDFSGGRFGDCLLSYLHAKWLAYEKNIPVIYRPFGYSSQLVLEEKERTFSNLGSEPRMRVYWGVPPNPNIRLPLLYICPYFPEDPWELTYTKRSDGSDWVYFKVDWKDPHFRQIVREMVAPKKNLALSVPPKDRISIAIHFREGGDYDFSDKYEKWPMKFPPLQFYIDSLLSAIEWSGGKPLYCHVFTDALNPGDWVEKIQAAVPPETPIVFDYRKKNNKPSANVLEDFFSLFNFDILIRPQSNFSLVPSLIHDFALVYSPIGNMGPDGKVTITQVNVDKDENLCWRLLQ